MRQQEQFPPLDVFGNIGPDEGKKNSNSRTADAALSDPCTTFLVTSVRKTSFCCGNNYHFYYNVMKNLLCIYFLTLVKYMYNQEKKALSERKKDASLYKMGKLSSKFKSI